MQRCVGGLEVRSAISSSPIVSSARTAGSGASLTAEAVTPTWADQLKQG